MIQNQERKVFIGTLPKDKRGRIDWVDSETNLVNFTYDGVSGQFKIIKYLKDKRKVEIEYNNKRYFISTHSIINAKLDRIIKENDSDNSIDKWSEEEIEILQKYFPTKSKYEMEKLLPKRNKVSIQTQAQRLGIEKTKERKLESKLENINLVNNFQYKENGFDTISEYVNFINSQKKQYIKNLNEAFYQYKQILNNERIQFGNNVVNKYDLIILFKYYLRLNKINEEKEYLLSLNYTDICVESKLDSLIQKYYSGYYDFICACYPKYYFKRWEFKILDCPNKYWSNKYNIFY